MNALTVFVFALPAMLAGRRGGFPAMVVLVLLMAAHVGFGYVRLTLAPAPGGKVLNARLVQPSVDQSRKWDASVRDEIFSNYLEMSARPPEQGASRPQLVVWPETSIPFLLQQRPQALAALGELVQDGQTLLAGAVRFEGVSPTDPATRFYNSVVAVNSAGVLYDATDKVHLVPLGEFVPFADLLARIGITKLVELPGGFSAGAGRHAIKVEPGIKVAPFICYEVIFPGIVAAEAPDARLIVNVTNDGWFGNSPGPYQHLRQAQVRSVEAGRPMLRAANNGISAAIDAHGRIVDALRLDGVGVLDVALPLDPADALRPTHPAAIGWLVVAALAGAGLIGRVRRPARVN
jgi:apolipoprotein N-acyltransferase